MAFYKLEQDQLLCGQNFVYTPTIALKADEKNKYVYPIEGWYWFDTFKDALIYFANNYDNTINSQV